MSEKIDEQMMSEIIKNSQSIEVLGIRGTGYEGDILDLIVDGQLYYIIIQEVIKP